MQISLFQGSGFTKEVKILVKGLLFQERELLHIKIKKILLTQKALIHSLKVSTPIPKKKSKYSS